MFYLIFREQRKRLGIHREILTNEKQGLKQSSPKFSRKDETISFSKYIFASFTYETILLLGFLSECVRQFFWISEKLVESVVWFELNFVVIGWSYLRRYVSKLLRVLTDVAFYVTFQTDWMPAANLKRLSACHIETDKKRKFSILTQITENQIDGFFYGGQIFERE